MIFRYNKMRDHNITLSFTLWMTSLFYSLKEILEFILQLF